jgi:hypothetical protein
MNVRSMDSESRSRFHVFVVLSLWRQERTRGDPSVMDIAEPRKTSV